jgi:protein TonB
VATPAPQPSPTPSAPRSQTAAKPKPQAESRGTHRPGAQDGNPRPGGKNGNGGGAGNGGGGGGTAALPRYRTNPKPVYPPEARRDRQEGVVLLSVEIGADGEPKSVVLKRTSGFPLLDEAALRAVRRWSFLPATMAGLPVASSADVPIRFNLAQ